MIDYNNIYLGYPNFNNSIYLIVGILLNNLKFPTINMGEGKIDDINDSELVRRKD
jgi:hypothetical protein